MVYGLVEMLMGLWDSTYKQGRSDHVCQCNGVVSHGAQIWDLWVFTYCTHKHKCVTMIFGCCAGFYASLSSCSDCSRVWWHIRINHSYFDYGKSWRSQFEPHAGIKVAQVLDLPYISVCGPHHIHVMSKMQRGIIHLRVVFTQLLFQNSYWSFEV